MVLLAILFDLHSKDFFFYSCGGIAIKKRNLLGFQILRFHLDACLQYVDSVWLLKLAEQALGLALAV